MSHNTAERRSIYRDFASSEALYLFLSTAALWFSLYVSRKIFASHPLLWIALPTVLSFALLHSRVEKFEKGNIRLLQLIGTLSAIYSVTHYPLIPLSGNPQTAGSLYILLFTLWMISVLSGVFCYRYPSLALLAPTFLLWSKFAATIITGLQHEETLDVQPLSDVACCLAFGFTINRVLGLMTFRLSEMSAAARLSSMESFAKVSLVTAISIHLANYFWSFVAKASLDNDPTAWVFHNDTSNIFLVASDNNHVLFSNHTELVSLIYQLIHLLHIPVNIFVFAIQGLAIIGFLLPRRGLIILVLAYDLMHVMIMVLAGANFWPWIMLNVAVAYVVANRSYLSSSWNLGLYSLVFILLATHVVNPARLGWYDTKVNNRMIVEAIDRNGKEYYVPTNFFTFYSYPMGLLGYWGTPGPAEAFWIGGPNGGAGSLWKVKAAEACDVELLREPDPFQSNPHEPLKTQEFSAYLKGYHALVLGVIDAIGVFPYNFYPHHFYDKSSLANEGFGDLDKRDIVAYIYRRESVCLSMVDGALHRRVVSTAEYRVNVP
jgi:hypothetical protein